MSNCTEKIKTDECIQTRDDGYNECDKWADEGSSKCKVWEECDWFTPWNCIAGLFCLLYHWVANWVCKGFRWIENLVCVVWKYTIVFGCILIDIATTVLGVIVAIIDVIIGIVGGILGILWGLILAIPILGGIINTIFNGLKAIIYAIISIPDVILAIFDIMPEKKLRLLVYIQKDSKGIPLISDENMDIVKRYIQYTINTFRKEVNVRLVPVNFFTYNSAFQDDNTSLDKFILNEDFWNTDATLDVCCDACAFGQDLLTQGSIFNIKMSIKGFLSSGRRILGYGSPIIAFAVRSYTDGKAGCSLGPISDYVTIKFNTSIITTHTYDALQPDQLHDAVSDLAHEIAHACGLPHFDSDNLMQRSPSRMGKLTFWQKVIVRSSRQVTYL